MFGKIYLINRKKKEINKNSLNLKEKRNQLERLYIYDKDLTSNKFKKNKNKISKPNRVLIPICFFSR